MPQLSKSVSIASVSASREVAMGLFFGPQAVGLGIGGPDATISINNNDDFSRFIILIWTLYAGFEILQPNFVTCARSYVA